MSTKNSSSKSTSNKNNLSNVTKNKTSKVPKKYTLLMIEDEEVCSTALELTLSDSEYNVICASSGREGLDYVINNSGKVDIILLDLMMPDTNGIEVITEFNKISCKIPVIIQTGSYHYSDISKALKLGAKNFLSKPYDKKILMSVLSKALVKDNKDENELVEV